MQKNNVYHTFLIHTFFFKSMRHSRFQVSVVFYCRSMGWIVQVRQPFIVWHSKATCRHVACSCPMRLTLQLFLIRATLLPSWPQKISRSCYKVSYHVDTVFLHQCIQIFLYCGTRLMWLTIKICLLIESFFSSLKKTNPVICANSFKILVRSS